MLHIFSSSVGGLVLLSPCTNYGSLLNIEEASSSNSRLPDIATHLPESSRRRVMKKPQDVLIGLYNWIMESWYCTNPSSSVFKAHLSMDKTHTVVKYHFEYQNCSFQFNNKCLKLIYSTHFSVSSEKTNFEISLNFKLFCNILASIDQVFWINFQFQVSQIKFRYQNKQLKYFRITRAQKILKVIFWTKTSNFLQCEAWQCSSRYANR